MNIYSNWSIDKLNKEVQKIQKVIKLKQSRDRKIAIAKVKEVAKKSGFELHELFGTESSGDGAGSSGRKSNPTRARQSDVKPKKSRKVAPKFRNPSDEKETWTGRGRQPIWVRNLLESGGSLDNAAIRDK